MRLLSLHTAPMRHLFKIRTFLKALLSEKNTLQQYFIFSKFDRAFKF